MYPFIRLALSEWQGRRMGPLGLFDTHEVAVTILPWDLDPWWELNNGRTLTLFDIGRMPLTQRMGVDKIAADKGWMITVAGTNTRYRRRLTVFQRVTCRSRILGWDKRFIYIEQGFWRQDDCTSHMILRYAVAGAGGIVDPADLLDAMGRKAESPPLPNWVQAWAAADATRPWPPQM
jgi:acyl-CoA thioesterase FadM